MPPSMTITRWRIFLKHALCMCMKQSRQYGINVDAEGNSRAIRAVYGKCGFESIFLPTGHGITGVKLVYETE